MMPRFQPGDYDDFGNLAPNREGDGPEPEPERARTGDRPARSSGMALASLICGVMFCVTPIPSLFATIFGVIALRETQDRSVSGRGFAVVGLMLGLSGVAIWLFLSAFIYLVVNVYQTETTEAAVVAKAFLQDLADGKIDAAVARSTPGIDRKPLEEASVAMKPWGPLKSLVGSYSPIKTRRGEPRWKVNAEATFSRGNCEVSLELVKDGTTYLVEHFKWKK